MKRTIFIFLILMGLSTFGYSQTKNDDILRLLRISGTSEIAVQTMEAMIPQFQQLVPDIPDIFWVKFRENLNIDDLLIACIPTYDRYFTHDEIRQLIIFHESPLGRRLAEVTPLLNQEVMIIGQRWGEQLGQNIVYELIREGYIGN